MNLKAKKCSIHLFLSRKAIEEDHIVGQNYKIMRKRIVAM